MAEDITLELEADSRFKDTALLFDVAEGTGSHFAVSGLPDEFRPTESDRLKSKSIRIKAHHLGRLDKIAYDEYGKVTLWWVIAAWNDYFDPMLDMNVGDILYLPDVDLVDKFLRR